MPLLRGLSLPCNGGSSKRDDPSVVPGSRLEVSEPSGVTPGLPLVQPPVGVTFGSSWVSTFLTSHWCSMAIWVPCVPWLTEPQSCCVSRRSGEKSLSQMDLALLPPAFQQRPYAQSLSLLLVEMPWVLTQEPGQQAAALF